MVSRIICILLFFPLLSFGQNLEFIESVLISEPGEYSVPEGEVWKLKSVTGIPSNIQIESCGRNGYSGYNAYYYTVYFVVYGYVFSINSINYGPLSSETTELVTNYNVQCPTFNNYDMSVDEMEYYTFNTEIYLSSSDFLELNSYGVQANILKFKKD